MKVPHLEIRVQDKITTDQLKVRYQKQLSDREKYEAEMDRSKSTGSVIQKYYVEFKNFYNSQKVSSNCNDITFINLGSNPVTLDGAITLQQNQSLQISGNINEMDTTEYDVRFSAYSSPNNNLLVIRKLYK
jgi:hypothetical protein